MLDKDGQLDLVKVTILRPDVDFPVPAPWWPQAPINKGLTSLLQISFFTHKMEGDLPVKPAGKFL